MTQWAAGLIIGVASLFVVIMFAWGLDTWRSRPHDLKITAAEPGDDIGKRVSALETAAAVAKAEKMGMVRCVDGTWLCFLPKDDTPRYYRTGYRGQDEVAIVTEDALPGWIGVAPMLRKPSLVIPAYRLRELMDKNQPTPAPKPSSPVKGKK